MKIYQLNAKRQFNDYIEIGHDIKSPVDLWAYINGELKIYRNMQPGDNHYEIWGGDLSDDDYFGRFDQKRRYLSIATPERFKGREIPSGLIKALHEKFGADAQIYEF